MLVLPIGSGVLFRPRTERKKPTLPGGSGIRTDRDRTSVKPNEPLSGPFAVDEMEAGRALDPTGMPGMQKRRNFRKTS